MINLLSKILMLVFHIVYLFPMIMRSDVSIWIKVVAMIIIGTMVAALLTWIDLKEEQNNDQ